LLALDELIEAERPSVLLETLSRFVGRRRLRTLAFLVLFVALWADLAREWWWPASLPDPLETVAALATGIGDGSFLRAAADSVARLLVGYLIGVVVGVALGAALTAHEIVEDTVGALVAGLRRLPGICWLPLAGVWFGLDDLAVLLVVVLASVFSVIDGVVEPIRPAIQVERGLREASRTRVQPASPPGAGDLESFGAAVIQLARPSVVAGLKQGWALAWRSLLAAELLMPAGGLGGLLQAGPDPGGIDTVAAAMVVIAAVGAACDRVFARLERRVAAP
jgi:NitT/TauT family transport system permease protein